MATKNIKKGKDTTRTTAADPFAAVAEPSDGETSKRPKRATKNAKVPKVAAAKAPPQSTEETKAIATTEPKVELSPLFKALADVKLPELPRENRARLQMQSPTRLYFYWSLRQNPWQQLRAVFGPELGSYTLV